MVDYVFTSITSNYIPKARVLAKLVKEHSPEARFCLLLAELGAPQELSGEAFDEVVTLDRLPIRDRQAWIFKHDLVELCTAVKGFYLDELLGRSDCRSVFYFDPDIVVFTSLEELGREFERGSVLLTPHLTTPDPTLEAIRDNEMAALRHGVYNLGFLAVASGEGGRAFARWWRSRLEHFCYDEIPEGLFTDQRWVDLAPAFFDDVAIVRDPGWNVATWNLPGRRVEGSVDSGFTVNGRPLRFYHFSGLDSGAQLAMLDKYGGSMPALYDLRAWYLRRCEEEDAITPTSATWSLDYYDNGERITSRQRQLYRRRLDLQEAFPDPFSTSDINKSYYHWYAANQADESATDVQDVRARAALYQRELAALYASRTWRLASGLARLWRALRRLVVRRGSV